MKDVSELIIGAETSSPLAMRLLQSKGSDLDPALFEQVTALLEENYPLFDEKDVEAKSGEIALFRKEDVLQQTLKNDSFILALTKEGKVIGFINCCDKKTETFIYWMVVDPAYQRRGVAKELHIAYERYFVDALRKNNRADLLQALTCDARNPITKVYEKWGYKDVRPDEDNPQKRYFQKGKKQS